MGRADRLVTEHHHGGTAVDTHPLDLIRPWLKEHRYLDSKTMKRTPSGRRVRTAGLVIVRQRPPTAGGMLFVTLEDEKGFVDLVVPPTVRKRFRTPLLTHPILAAEGILERDGNSSALKVTAVHPLYLADEPIRNASRDFRWARIVFEASRNDQTKRKDLLVDAFEGVGPKLAQRIVAARPYSTQRELGKVPGLGRALYHRMTGDSLPRGRVAMEEISEILGDPAHGMPKFKAVAQAVAELPGVSGCVLSHTDGYLLAQAWKRGKGQSIGAIAPQLFKQVGKYFELLQMEGPDSMTLFVEPRPVFITRSGDVFMIVFVSRSRLSARRVTFLEVLASELTGRLKHGAAQ